MDDKKITRIVNFLRGSWLAGWWTSLKGELSGTIVGDSSGLAVLWELLQQILPARTAHGNYRNI